MHAWHYSTGISATNCNDLIMRSEAISHSKWHNMHMEKLAGCSYKLDVAPSCISMGKLSGFTENS